LENIVNTTEQNINEAASPETAESIRLREFGPGIELTELNKRFKEQRDIDTQILRSLEGAKRHGEQNIVIACEENLTVNPCKSAKITEGIRLREQQIFDMKLLHLWAWVEEKTEYKPEQVKSFTYRPEFLTKEQRKRNSRAALAHSAPGYCDKNWHNALRLRSGEIVEMPGIVRPIPPGWMPTSVERKL
jgi:hypothetical protein